MTPLRSPDIFDEIAELLAEGYQNLVLILDRFCVVNGKIRTIRKDECTRRRKRAPGKLGPTVKKGDELLSRALSAECKGNGRQPVDGVETEENVVVLQDKTCKRLAVES